MDQDIKSDFNALRLDNVAEGILWGGKSVTASIRFEKCLLQDRIIPTDTLSSLFSCLNCSCLFDPDSTT